MCTVWTQISNRRKTGVFHRGKLYLTEEMTLIPEFDIYRYANKYILLFSLFS